MKDLYQLQHSTPFAGSERCWKPSLIMKRMSRWKIRGERIRSMMCEILKHVLNMCTYVCAQSYTVIVYTVHMGKSSTQSTQHTQRQKKMLSSHHHISHHSVQGFCRWWGVFDTSLKSHLSIFKVQKQLPAVYLFKKNNCDQNGVNFCPSLLVCRPVVTSQHCIQYGAEAVGKNQCWQRPPPRSIY